MKPAPVTMDFRQLLRPGLRKELLRPFVKPVKPLNVEFYRGAGGWRFRFVSPENGKRMANGLQGYSRARDCVHNFNRVTGNNAPEHRTFVVSRSGARYEGLPGL